MTATVPPPAPPAADAAPPDVARTRPPSGRVDAPPLTPTIALAAVTVATAIGMIRLFADWSFLRPMVLVVVAVHLVGYLLRWARVPGWVAVPLSVLAGLSAIGLAYHQDTVSLGLPTPALIGALRADLRLVFDQFSSAVAPVPSVGAFAISATLLLAVCAIVADTFAFRAFGRLEAVVPAGLVFIFTSALGADRSRIAVSMVWVAAALVCVAVLRAYHQTDEMAWLGRPRRNLVGVAVVAAVVATFIAGVSGWAAVRIPGAGDDPLIDTRNRIGDVTQVVSPLVDVRSRLVNRKNTTMVTVEATFASYWRLSGLSEFDGRIWRPAEQDLGTLDRLQELPPGVPTNQQTITIGALGGPLVPGAPEPVLADADLAWADASDSLVLADGGGLQRGQRFDILSALVEPTPEQLRSATSSQAPAGSRALPDDIPSEALELARQVTAGATTDYDRAIALQNWFRDPNEFEYEINVQLGHSGDAIREFLDIRQGYCEQFASTFAVMARSLGIPARVAVGFTSGRMVAPGRYQVLGRNTHAWAEVWFDGFGWVLFEPTPGRGAPGTQGHTGVDPAQDESTAGSPQQGEEGADPPPVIEQPTATTLPGAGPAPTTVPAATEVDTSDGSVPVPLLVILVALALAGLWYWQAPRLAAHRHRSRDQSPVGRVAHAWSRTVAALRRAGAPRPGGDTPGEYARTVERQVQIDGRALRELARHVTVATFSPGGVDDLTARRAEVLSYEIAARARTLQTGWQRFVDRVTLR